MVTRALALMFVLLGTACATTQMSPNRRLAQGEGVISVAGDIHPSLFPARLGALLAGGLGGGDVVGGDLEATAALLWYGSAHLTVGGRVYAGPVNVTGRAGLMTDFVKREDESWVPRPVPADVGWLPIWDARITTVSSDARRFYFGVHNAGFVERVQLGDGTHVGTPRFRAGLLAGFEVWNTVLPVQVEVTLNLLELERGRLGFLRAVVSDRHMPLSGFAQVIHVGVAFHLPFGAVQVRPSTKPITWASARAPARRTPTARTSTATTRARRARRAACAATGNASDPQEPPT